MWKERLRRMFHYRYGDTLTSLLMVIGYWLSLSTFFTYREERYLDKTSLVLGLITFIGGILYKELIYDKKKENNNKGE